MRKLLVEIRTPEESLKLVARLWKEAEAGKRIDTSRMGFGSMAELTAIFTPRRMELLHYVAQHPRQSIRALARALKRDYKNVHTDVLELESNFVVERDTKGLVSSPYDEIIIRAPLRKAA